MCSLMNFLALNIKFQEKIMTFQVTLELHRTTWKDARFYFSLLFLKKTLKHLVAQVTRVVLSDTVLHLLPS